MPRPRPSIAAALACALCGPGRAPAQEPAAAPAVSPLPPGLRRSTSFGERADWSADGRHLVFQEARSQEPAGVGHGILILEVGK